MAQDHMKRNQAMLLSTTKSVHHSVLTGSSCLALKDLIPSIDAFVMQRRDANGIKTLKMLYVNVKPIFHCLHRPRKAFYHVKFHHILTHNRDNGLATVWMALNCHGLEQAQLVVYVSSTDQDACYSVMKKLVTLLQTWMVAM